MAYSSPVESILYALASWLQTGIGAYLTGISSAMADGITLTAPAVYEVSDADPWGHTRYPAVTIYPSEAPVESDIDSGHDELMVRAQVLIAMSGGAPASGTKRMLRYAEAVREMVRDSRSMGGNADLISTKNIMYAPVDPDKPAVRIVTVEVEIRKTLSRY